LKVFKKKRLVMATGYWGFNWDNAPMHTAAVVTDWMAAGQIRVIEQLPCSQGLTLADFFLSPRIKRELASLNLTQETLKKEWEGAGRTL
jgi:hypothetical protein